MAFTKFRHNTVPLTEKSYNQNLKQTTEIFEKFGSKCLYIPRVEVDETLVGGNYLDMLYDAGQEIYLRVTGHESVDEGNFFSKFGYSDQSSLEFFGSIEQFAEISIVPEIGDLIYVEDLNKKLYEVTHSTHQTVNNKYVFGKPSTFQLKCKLHNIDLISTYTTGNIDIDSQDNESDETDTKMNNEITQKITDNNIVDNSESNPLNDFE